MSINNEIEAGRKHIAPVEHRPHKRPPQEHRHNITPINLAPAEVERFHIFVKLSLVGERKEQFGMKKASA